MVPEQFWGLPRGCTHLLPPNEVTCKMESIQPEKPLCFTEWKTDLNSFLAGMFVSPFRYVSVFFPLYFISYFPFPSGCRILTHVFLK